MLTIEERGFICKVIQGMNNLTEAVNNLSGNVSKLVTTIQNKQEKTEIVVRNPNDFRKGIR